MAEKVKVYFAGWFEYEVNNPSALVDAGKLSPYNAGGSALHVVPPEKWEELAFTAMTEVTKRFKLQAPPLPGATAADQRVTFAEGPNFPMPE
jgi:hypothetical protein